MLIGWLDHSVDAAQRGSSVEPRGADPVGDAAVIGSGEPGLWATATTGATDDPEKTTASSLVQTLHNGTPRARREDAFRIRTAQTVDPRSPRTAYASLRGRNEIRTRTVRADAMNRC
jgi:hypothetical protein